VSFTCIDLKFAVSCPATSAPAADFVKVADAWIGAHGVELVVDPHDFSGVVPYARRMDLKQGRFEQCLREWKTESKT